MANHPYVKLAILAVRHFLSEIKAPDRHFKPLGTGEGQGNGFLSERKWRTARIASLT